MKSNIKLSKYTFLNVSIISLSILYIITISLQNKTISPSWFWHDYTPWKLEKDNEDVKTNYYGYRHLGHDQVTQFFINRYDDLKTKELESRYSYQFQLGLPKDTRIEFSNFSQKIILNFLDKFWPKNKYSNIQIAVNFSSLVVFLITFIILQLILCKIFGKKNEIILFSLILNPIFFLPSEEGWQLPVMGIYFFLLSFILLQNSSSKINNIISTILSFFAGCLTINGMSFHFWMYTPMIILFFSFYIYKEIGFKSFFLIVGLLLSFLVNINLIYEVLINLDTSSSKISLTKFYNSINSLEYAMIPMGYFIPNLILKDLFINLNINWPFNSLINLGEGFFGIGVIILSTYSVFKLKKTLYIPIILCLLYWMGPLQFMLRFLVGGPFITETSVGGRFGTIIYIILNFLTIYGYFNLKNLKFYKYRNYIFSLLILIITFTILQFFYFLLHNKIWIFGFIYFLSVVVFLVSLKSKNIYFYIALSIFIIPCYSTFSKFGKNSIFPSKIIEVNPIYYDKINFRTDDVALIATKFNNKRYIKKPIHPNTLAFLDIRSLNGFVTPVNRYFLTLYNYQWLTNWPNSSIDTHLDPNNKINKKIENIEYILKYSHRHYSFPIPIIDKFSSQSEKYFDLVGLKYVFAEDKINMIDGYTLVKKNQNGFNIWKRNKFSKPISIVCNIKKFDYNISSFETLLSGKFDHKNTIIVYENINYRKCNNEVKDVNYKFNQKGENFFEAEIYDSSGILKTNIVWHPNLKAKDDKNLLKIFRCNGSFTCVVPKNEKKIKIYYKKPNLLKYLTKHFKNE